MKKSKIYVVGHCDTGFGDQYASLITCYNTIVKLKERGYVPHLFLSKEHKYFSLKTHLSVIYNLSTFECDYEEMRYIEVLKKLEGFKKIIVSSFLQIWVDHDNNDNFSFLQTSISMYTMSYLDDPIITDTIINQEIIDISKEKFIKNRKNIVTLHYRTSDSIMKADLDTIKNDFFWGDKFNKSIKYIEKYKDYDVMVCSANRNVSNFFSENFSNVFTNEFSNKNLGFHIIYGYDFTEDDTQYVEHSKEILAEMIAIQWSKKIYSIASHPSNFTFYGTINNVTYSTFKERLKYLHFNDDTDFN